LGQLVPKHDVEVIFSLVFGSVFGCYITRRLYFQGIRAWVQKWRPKARYELSEYDVMRSVGITLGGPDPIDQQLQELDAQSRIMCGLPVLSSRGSEDAAASVSPMLRTEPAPDRILWWFDGEKS
jgi:hypothetical protein